MECNANRNDKETTITTTNFVHSLLGDLANAAVNNAQLDVSPLKARNKNTNCLRLWDIIGPLPFVSRSSEEDCNEQTPNQRASMLAAYSLNTSSRTHRCRWHSWLLEALAEDNSEDEVMLYERRVGLKLYCNSGCQTEQPRFKKRIPGVLTPGDRALQAQAPCELTRQTLFFEALSYPPPNVLVRAPLSDRFCYMLTDFASALYCSLAIMCCCTPNMFR